MRYGSSRYRLIAACAVIVSLSSAAGCRAAPEMAEVSGTIQAISTSPDPTITIKTASQSDIKLWIDRKRTGILRDSRAALIGDLRKGDRVTVHYRKAARRPTATHIVARAPTKRTKTR